jgi:hypothetical protein
VTPNDEVNSLFAREAREEFGVPSTYVAVGRSAGLSATVLARQGSRILFDRPKDVERWSVRLRHGAARRERWRFALAPKEPPSEVSSSADPWLVLTLARGGSTEPMRADLVPREGDLAQVLVHEPESALAEEALRARGWEPAPADTDA